MNKNLIATLSSINTLASTLKRVYSQALRGEDITPLQHQVLTIIKTSRGMLYQDLALTVQVHQPSLTRIVRALEKLEYAAYDVKDSDQRCKYIRITRKGAEALKRIAETRTKGVNAKLKKMGTKELADVLEAAKAFNSKCAENY